MSDFRRQINILLREIKQSGDNDKKSALFNLVCNHLSAVARSYAKSKTDVDDIVVNAVLRAFRYIDSYKTSMDGLNWLCKIVQREAYSQNSLRNRTEFVEDLPEVAYSETGFDGVEARDEIDRILQPFTEKERKIVFLRFMYGLTVREIAKHVGLSKTAVHKTLKKVALALEKYK